MLCLPRGAGGWRGSAGEAAAQRGCRGSAAPFPPGAGPGAGYLELWGGVSLAALPWRGGAGPGWSHGELSLHGRGRAALPPRFMGCGAAVPPEPRAAHRLPPPPPGRFPRFRKGRNYGNPIRGPWKHDAGSREPQRGRLALPCPVPAPPPARGAGAPAGTGVREGNTRAFGGCGAGAALNTRVACAAGGPESRRLGTGRASPSCALLASPAAPRSSLAAR